MRSRQGRKRLSHCVFGCSIAFLHLHQTSSGENWGFAGLPGQRCRRGNVFHSPVMSCVFLLTLSSPYRGKSRAHVNPSKVSGAAPSGQLCLQSPPQRRAGTSSIPKATELKLAPQKDFSGSELYHSHAVSTSAVNLEVVLPCVQENCF